MSTLQEKQSEKDENYLNQNELPIIRVKIKVSEVEENEESERLKSLGIETKQKITTRYETAALDIRTVYFMYKNEDRNNGEAAVPLEFKTTQDRLTVYHDFDQLLKIWVKWSKLRKSKK